MRNEKKARSVDIKAGVVNSIKEDNRGLLYSEDYFYSSRGIRSQQSYFPVFKNGSSQQILP